MMTRINERHQVKYVFTVRCAVGVAGTSLFIQETAMAGKQLVHIRITAHLHAVTRYRH